MRGRRAAGGRVYIGNKTDQLVSGSHREAAAQLAVDADYLDMTAAFCFTFRICCWRLSADVILIVCCLRYSIQLF